MSSLIKIILSIAFVILLLIAGPWCMIWAVNTLIINSGLVPALIGASAVDGPIVFTFWTWLAAVVLGGFSIIARFRHS